jgi:outer membrane receptor protein involved in Fe transport
MRLLLVIVGLAIATSSLESQSSDSTRAARRDSIIKARRARKAKEDSIKKARLDSVRRLVQVNVSSSRGATDPTVTPLAVTTLRELEIHKSGSISLGYVLDQVPGLRNVSTGGQIGKPVIRGLGGPRVLFLDNGFRLEQYGWSYEEGPPIDPQLAQEIDVVKGPASVLYGGDAIGGAVNTLAKLPPLGDINWSWRSTIKERGIDVFGASNAGEAGASLRSAGTIGRMGWRLVGTGRTAGSAKTPEGTLDNTWFHAANIEGSAVVPWQEGVTTARYVRYSGNWGILKIGRSLPFMPITNPEERGPERHARDDRLQIHDNRFIAGYRVETRWQWQRHRVDEWTAYLDDSITLPTVIPYTGGPTPGSLQLGQAPLSDTIPWAHSFIMQLNTFTTDVVIHNQPFPKVTGAIGLGMIRQFSRGLGILNPIPDASATGFSAYLLERADLGRVTLLGGLRHDFRSTRPDSLFRSKRYEAQSGNAGAIVRLTPSLSVTGNLSTGWRAPSMYELYVVSLNFANFRWEFGRPNAKPERSFNIDGGLQWDYSMGNVGLRADASVYRHRIKNYTYLSRQRTPDWLSGGDDTLDVNATLYFHRQTDAVLSGGEAFLQVDPGQYLTLTAAHDRVIGTDEKLDNEPLPYMPSPRTSFGATLHSKETTGRPTFYVGGKIEFNARQTRIGETESFNAPTTYFYGTDAYRLINLEAGFARRLQGRNYHIDARVTNLGNATYRSFLNSYREVAPNPGRDFQVRVSTDF